MAYVVGITGLDLADRIGPIGEDADAPKRSLKSAMIAFRAFFLFSGSVLLSSRSCGRSSCLGQIQPGFFEGARVVLQVRIPAPYVERAARLERVCSTTIRTAG